MTLDKKNIIIISILSAVVVGLLGYSIIKKQMAGQIIFRGGEQTINQTGVMDEVYNLTAVNQKNQLKQIVVHIVGHVKNPGLVKLPEGARIADAIEAAGGVLPDADLEIINLAYKLQDGKQVYIPPKGGELDNKSANSFKSINTRVKADKNKLIPGVQPEKPPLTKAGSNYDGVIKNQEAQLESEVVNINTADVNELDKLPGIGPSTAKKIIEYREKHGLFANPEDIMKVKGIGPSKYEKIKDKITV